LESALRGSSAVAVIAELKRASPSRGALNEQMDQRQRGRDYAAGGARALSVLTEPDEFGARPNDLFDVASAVTLPILQKDFHVGEAQVWEARARGASALLLIARALAPAALRDLVAVALGAGIEPLVEVRSEDELALALDAQVRLIGVNARNLETLAIEPNVSARLLPLVPRQCVAIAESGIITRGDVEAAAAMGADAVLVGSSLSTAADAREAVRALVGVLRASRAP
jgi:indole-3-glycerol phosphate synthase